MKLTNLGLGALAAALVVGAPMLASAQQYGGYGNGGNRSTRGTIASVNGSNVTLRDGRQIFLENGTVIQPTGERLQVGQQISVQGNPGGNGAINATNVSIGNYGGRGTNRYANGNDSNGYGRSGEHRYRHHHESDRNGHGNDNGYGNGNGNGNDGNDGNGH